MVARGLKSKIAINVALLVLLSAVLTDILIIVVMQNFIARQRVEDSQFIIDAIGRLYISQNVKHHSGSPKDAESNLVFDAKALPFPALGIWDRSGKRLFYHQSGPHGLSLSQSDIQRIIASGDGAQAEIGRIWSLFWWHPAASIITTPIVLEEHVVGLIAATVPFGPLVSQLRQYHHAIMLYILINTGILTVVGLYRIFRLYLRPIDRIVTQADHFREDDDPFFAFRQEDNELNRLSLSLNRMLERISSDKKILRETVQSLEAANKDLKRAQQEIIRAEKLASVGRLAAGIAHEIGNPIGIVLGYLDLLRQDDLTTGEKEEFLTRTETEVQRINSIIRQLLDMARTKEAKAQPIQVHAVIQDVVDMMAVQPLMTQIEIRCKLAASHDTVMANGDQIRQVLLNLLLNAGDAIGSNRDSDGGRITISSRTVDAGDNETGDIEIDVEDNGPGISDAQLQDIFDPFYTTKEPGKGTGLGLAVSYMIIDSLGGSITAQNRPEGGACFTILLKGALGE